MQHISQGRGGPQLSRRAFLQYTASGIAISIIPIADRLQAAEPMQSTDFGNDTPGVATHRIDGVAKVTGQKIYARDYNARDFAKDGWPADQWYAMYLRATTTTRRFLGVDLSALPTNAQPAKIIYGDQLTGSVNAPILTTTRDQELDRKLEAIKAPARKARAEGDSESDSFDRPGAVEFDLIVQRGNLPDFLGQAVVLLMFNTRASWRAAKRLLQFNDNDFQQYAPTEEPNPNAGMIFPPQTLYVRVAGDTPGSSEFSYATNATDYDAQAAVYQKQIRDRLNTDPDLIKQDIDVDMRAMDPMFMEPESGLAYYDAGTTTLNLVLGTQSPDGDVRNIASMYGDPGAPATVSTVVLHSCYPGGGFGGRDSSPFSLMLALCATFGDGKPVKLEYDRFEQFRVGLKRHAATAKGVLAVRPDMTLDTIQLTMHFDGGGRKNLSPYVASLAALCAGGSYRSDYADIFANAHHSQNVSGGSQRGFGGPQAFFAIESAMDQIAVDQGWDPIAFRRHNALVEGDATVVGGPVDQQLRLGEMLDRAEAHPLWADRAAIKTDYASRGLTYGTGVAMSLQAYGTSGDGVIAAVGLDRDGRYTVRSDAVDMGNGSATTLGVVIGPILGANATTVDMGGYTLWDQMGMVTGWSLPDGQSSWDNPKWSAKSVGSSSACLTGLHQIHVMQQTANAYFAQAILPAARDLWALPALTQIETDWQSGALILKAGGKPPLPLLQIAAYIHDQGLAKEVIGHAYFKYNWVSGTYATQSGSQTFDLDGLTYYPANLDQPQHIWRTGTVPPKDGANRYARYIWAPCVNVVGVVVNRQTGTVQLENSLSVLNAGVVHVDQLVSGQSQGGVAMVVGYSLLEDMPPGMDGPASGEWNLNRYHVPRYGDVPLSRTYEPGKRCQILDVLPPTPADNGNGRGIAEAVMCSVAPAIANAIHDAVGVRFSSLPITPEKILRGLAQ